MIFTFQKHLTPISSIVFLLAFISAISSCSRSQNPSAYALPRAEQTGAEKSSEIENPRTALVKSLKANVRSQPSRSGSIVTTVKRGDRVVVTNSSSGGPWYQVRENKTGVTGWINGNAITFVSERSSKPATEVERQGEAATRPRTVTRTGSGRSYINVDGERVSSPVFSSSRPVGASARCRDGSYSFSRNRRGTCSHHGGVAVWL